MSVKTRLILAIAFGLALAAGTMLGVVVSARTARPPDERPEPRSRGDRERVSLVRELELTDEQQQQMKEIWSNVGRGGKEHFEQHRAIQEQREQAILSLFTPEQRAKYDRIESEYRRQADALAQERERKFEQAVAQTKKILTPQQQQKYDELLKRRREEHERRRPGQ